MTYQRHAGAVRRFGRVMRFASRVQQWPTRLTPAPFRLLQIGSAFWQSRALYAAARLDIATRLGEETLTAEEIASRIAADGDAIARLLRLLAALGVFRETAPRRFANNALSGWLRRDHPRNLRAMILLHNDPAMCRPWYESLEEGLREGRAPFALSHGQELFPYLTDHPELERLFADAMDSVEALSGDSFATDFDWSRFHHLIDLGGARGSKARTILRHHPRLRATVVERPSVVAEARQHREGDAEAERLTFLAADLQSYQPPPASPGDVFLLAAVLHCLDDAEAAAVLGRVAAAGAPVVVLEQVLPEQGADLTAASFDMQMFMGTRGRERTQAEWQALAVKAGVVLEEIVALRSFARILVFRRGH